MSIVNNIKFSQKVNDLELMLNDLPKGRKCIYLGKGDNIVMLKKFSGNHDFKKWMCEAAILRMVAGNQSVSKAREIYLNLAGTISALEQKNEEKNNF